MRRTSTIRDETAETTKLGLKEKLQEAEAQLAAGAKPIPLAEAIRGNANQHAT